MPKGKVITVRDKGGKLAKQIPTPKSTIKLIENTKIQSFTERDFAAFLEERNQKQAENVQEIEIYTPHEKQRLIAEDAHRYKVACVGRQFGKTEMALCELIFHALEKENGVYWYIAPYFAQAKDIAWSRLHEKLSLLPEKMYRTNESELSVTFLQTGSIIKLMGAENPDRLRGAVLDGIVCDEFAFWTKGDAFPKVIRLALAKKQGFSWFISTPNGYNFFYDLFCLESVDPSQWKSFHYTSYDNPYLPTEEIEAIKKTSSALVFAQEVLAEFNKPEGAIWADFARSIHVIPKYRPTNKNPIFASIDFGFAIDHPTCLLLHEIGDDGIVRTFDGFLQEGKDPSQIVEMVSSYTKGLIINAVYCDSARPDLIAMLRKANFPAKKSDKDVELGISKVAEYMRVDPITNKPRWQICGHMQEITSQIESYRWQQVRSGDGHYKSVPVKDKDDAPDALRYFLYTHYKPERNEREQINRILNARLNEAFY